MITCLLAITASSTGAQIYKVTDEDNGVVFTDRPQTAQPGQKVEEVELPTLNTAPATQVRPAQPAEERPAPAPEPGVTITQPADETTIGMGPGDFSVNASASPPLGTGESLLLFMDGERFGDPQRSGSWSVQGAMRGPHDLRVERRTQSGDTVAQSETVRVYVLRPSIINR